MFIMSRDSRRQRSVREMAYGASTVLTLRPRTTAIVNWDRIRAMPMGQAGIAADWLNVGADLQTAIERVVGDREHQPT